MPIDNIKEYLRLNSRRDFIRNTIAASAAIILPGSNKAVAQNTESGRITLDGLMYNYFSIPPRTRGRFSRNPTKRLSVSFRLRAVDAPDLSLQPNPQLDSDPFSVIQSQSTQLTDGLTLRRLPLFLGEGYNTFTKYNDSSIAGVSRPVLQLEGSLDNMQFRLLEVRSFFVLNIWAFSDGLNFSQRTQKSWLKQFVTDPAKLVEPRFALRAIVSVPARTRHIVTFVEIAQDRVENPAQATLIGTIIKQEGFTSDEAKRIFAVGNELKLRYAATQEFSGKLLSHTASFFRRTPGIYHVYWDYVFTCFLFVDVTEILKVGQVFIRGEVTDEAGTAKSNGVVVLQRNGVKHVALTDNEGRYSIGAVEDEPKGIWSLRCGNVSQKVEIDGAETIADIRGVSMESGAEIRFGDTEK